MPTELPLFPLNVVLFPGMALPLHIFEPRYRLMVRRCLEADRTFGVALLVAGEEGQPDTLPALAGCTAEILEATPFPDGRMNLQTIGRRRFRVLEMRREDEYLIGLVEWLDDALSTPRAGEQAVQVLHWLRRYLTALTQEAGLPDVALEELDIPEDPYALSMWIAALLALSNPQKQVLLELTTTEARLEAELAFLQRAEIVHRAFRRHDREQPETPSEDDPLGPFSPFVSPN
jgi:ATP-dependent Lon protease